MSKISHSASKRQGPRSARALAVAGLLLALAFPAAAQAIVAAVIAAALGTATALMTPLLIAAAAVMLLRAAPTTSRRAVTALAGRGAARVLVGGA